MTEYAVNDIYLTIQGEGVHAGRPAVFIRLQGCAVGCHFCDTKETWHRRPENRTLDAAVMHAEREKWMLLTAEQAVGMALALLPEPMIHRGWNKQAFASDVLCVVTGGEPAEQDLSDLALALRGCGFYTAIETSGTAAGFYERLPLEVSRGYPTVVRRSIARSLFDFVTVSPKMMESNIDGLDRDACLLADEIKMVIGKPSDLPRLSVYLQAFPPKPGAVVSVQPMSQSESATRLCISAALSRGWRVSIQLHKLLQLP